MLEVNPVIDSSVRRLCRKPYEGHPKGCPCFGKKEGCPPTAPLFWAVVDQTEPVFAEYNAFDLGAFVQELKSTHPDWSERRCRCCLYWQPGARKQLKVKVGEDLKGLVGYVAFLCPEAMGVNVTATMEDVGIRLEWPPINVAMQIALLGKLIRDRTKTNRQIRKAPWGLPGL